jgi:hypothetical protein
VSVQRARQSGELAYCDCPVVANPRMGATGERIAANRAILGPLLETFVMSEIMSVRALGIVRLRCL